MPLVIGRIRDRLKQLSARLGDAEWLDGEFSAGDLMMISVLQRLKNLPASLMNFLVWRPMLHAGKSGPPINVLSLRNWQLTQLRSDRASLERSKSSFNTGVCSQKLDSGVVVDAKKDYQDLERRLATTDTMILRVVLPILN